MDTFFQQIINGLVLGSLYALIALGYTMVYGGRCDRDISSYAFEELVAELGAAFLCADLSITLTPREDHAGYLASWLHCLTSDSHALTPAACRCPGCTHRNCRGTDGGAQSG